MNFMFWGLYGRNFTGIGKGETDLILQIGNTGLIPLKYQGKNSCGVAIAVKSNTPVYHHLLGFCQSEFRVLDLSATSGKHDLNPSLRKTRKSTLNPFNITHMMLLMFTSEG